jgi:hypothetical protein
MTRLPCLVVLVVTACSHGEDKHLTATEHRDLAALHFARADAEREQYDPSLTEDRVMRSPWVDLPDSVVSEYNPTSGHLAAADREMRRAARHHKQADKLEAFEAAACQNIPREQRAACPLLASQVERVQNDKKGVRLNLKPSADAVAIEQRLQCHLAWANTVGFDEPSCPLFVKGMAIGIKAPNVIVMHGDSPEVAEELQRHARRIFIGEPQGAPVSSKN